MRDGEVASVHVGREYELRGFVTVNVKDFDVLDRDGVAAGDLFPGPCAPVPVDEVAVGVTQDHRSGEPPTRFHRGDQVTVIRLGAVPEDCLEVADNPFHATLLRHFPLLFLRRWAWSIA